VVHFQALNKMPNKTKAKAAKRTGCRAGQDKNGKPYIRGWNVQEKRGMLVIFAREYSGTKTHKSASGREWRNWFVTATYEASGIERKLSGLYDPMTRKLIIPDLGMVLNPSKDYCGSFTKKG
jgi:hypothetical protein